MGRTPERIAADNVVRLGGLALSTEILGVNDPNTHLYMYLRGGEPAMKDIEEDMITDLTERLRLPRFINRVDSIYTGDDFISKSGGFSMRQMTAVTEEKFAGNVVDINQYRRAKIEAHEATTKLNGWFRRAEAGDSFIAESMGITDSETYSLVRLYQKLSDQELAMYVITLHNADVSIFNQLHERLEVEVPESSSELELLSNSYALNKPPSINFEEVVELYVDAYDGLIAERQPGRRFKFGLDSQESSEFQDDMEMIRGQKALRSVYKDCLRALADSGGFVTDKLTELNRRLNFGLEIKAGQAISSRLSASILDHAIQYTMATLDMASEESLQALANTVDMNFVYTSVGNYGTEAKTAGIRYEGACPSSNSSVEGQTVAGAFRKESTKCVKCPECKKTVDLPEDLLKEDIYHCVECKATYKKGRKIDYRDVIEEDRVEKKTDAFDILSNAVRAAGLGYEMKDLSRDLDLAEDEFTKERLQKIIAQRSLELNSLKQAA